MPNENTGSHMKKKKKSSASRRRKSSNKISRILKTVMIVLIAAVVLSGAALIVTVSQLSKKEDGTVSFSLLSPKETMKEAASSTELGQQAKKIKYNLGKLTGAMMDQNVKAAKKYRNNLLTNIADTKEILNKPVWKTASLVPGLRGQMKTAKELIDIVEKADEGIFAPYIELMTEYPFSELKTEEGFRVDLILKYLDFCEQVLPEGEAMIQRIEGLDLSLLDKDGKISKISDEGEGLISLLREIDSYIPAFRTILGDGSDRLYVFAAQNTSEMRASGGFPGSIGTVKIKDGYLNLTEFKAVSTVFKWETPYSAHITETENRLFENRLNYTWDADFCPDFERVASIWAMGFEGRHAGRVDGVISATPAVIQKLLAFLGEITLSDGTVLNGENATRVLGHDLYFKYLGSNPKFNGNDIVDGLFNECAEKTFQLLTSSFSVSNLKEYFNFFRESTSDRSMMFWMKDEKEQELIRSIGWNAGLNRDPNEPWIGIFFNSNTPSKMTWYLDIDYELSEPTLNADGSRSYDVTVTFSNVITAEERAKASIYILGDTSGITGTAFVFAPAGAVIESYESSDSKPRQDSYQDLELIYQGINVLPGQPYVVHCRIKTAPGVETPVEIVCSPTMQAYR